MDLNSIVYAMKQYDGLSIAEKARANNQVKAMRLAMAGIPVIRLVATQDFQNVLYEIAPSGVYSLNTFYNETCDFVINGKSRKMSPSTWESLLGSIANDMRKLGKPADSGLFSTQLVDTFAGNLQTVRSFGAALETKDVSLVMSSYADHEVFDLWVSRPDGLSDLIRTISIILKLVHPKG